MKNYKVILKKNKPSDSIGTLQIQYFNGKGVKKQISLSIKISEENYKKYYDDEFKQFRKNNYFDYKNFNLVIQKKTNNLNEEKTEPNKIYLINFLKERELKKNNLNSRSGLTTTRKHLSIFLEQKGLNDIDVEKIDIEFLIDFKNFLLGRDISGSTMLYYFILLKGELNYLSSENKYNKNLKYLFKKLNIKKITKYKNTLSNEDISKLLNTPKNYKYYKFVQIGLLQLFCSGLRQSDIFLLKYEDFLVKGIVIHTKKNKKEIIIPWENKLLCDVLCNIFDLEIPNQYTYEEIKKMRTGRNFVQNTTQPPEWEDYSNKKQLFRYKKKIYSHIRNFPPKELIFKDILNIPELNNYSKNIEMNDIQLQKWKSFCVKYNYRLKMIRKDLGLEIDNLSSHTFRYTYTKLLLENGIGIHEISQVLSHSNISITENYINRNFDTKNIKEMNDKIFKPFN
jgi:integrase